MYRKRLLLFIVIALMLTGCTKLDNNNVDTIVDATMTKKIKNVNTVSTGYILYMPVGVMQLVDNQYNQKFRIRGTYVYLYVDTISYYYKNVLNYKTDKNYNYYYKEIYLDAKTGYIGINKLSDDSLFVEIVYNYSKMEFYVNERDLSLVLANSLMIINSVEYNDNLIRLSLDDNINDGREVKYELDKPKDSVSTFDQFLQEYVDDEEVEVVLPDGE